MHGGWERKFKASLPSIALPLAAEPFQFLLYESLDRAPQVANELFIHKGPTSTDIRSGDDFGFGCIWTIGGAVAAQPGRDPIVDQQVHATRRGIAPGCWTRVLG